ncbi:hypothetical protein Tco_0181638 [Tanacetum coccineum]
MKAKTALYLLFQSVDESGFEKIDGALTAKQAWDTLEKAKETEGISDYITRVQTVVNQLKRNESKDLEDLTIEELAGSLEAHKQRKNKKKQESLDESLKTKATIKDEKALFAHQKNHGKGTNYGGHNTNRGRGRGRENNNQEREQTGKHFNQNSLGRGRERGRGGQGYCPKC